MQTWNSNGYSEFSSTMDSTKSSPVYFSLKPEQNSNEGQNGPGASSLSLKSARLILEGSFQNDSQYDGCIKIKGNDQVRTVLPVQTVWTMGGPTYHPIQALQWLGAPLIVTCPRVWIWTYCIITKWFGYQNHIQAFEAKSRAWPNWHGHWMLDQISNPKPYLELLLDRPCVFGFGLAKFATLNI